MPAARKQYAHFLTYKLLIYLSVLGKNCNKQQQVRLKHSNKHIFKTMKSQCYLEENHRSCDHLRIINMLV